MPHALMVVTSLAVLSLACASSARNAATPGEPQKESKESKVSLLDETEMTVGEVAVVELIPAGTLGATLVLAAPVPLEHPIPVKLLLPEGDCDLILTGITRIGPKPRPGKGSRAAEYAMTQAGGCELKRKKTYRSSRGEVKTGDTPDRLQPHPYF